MDSGCGIISHVSHRYSGGELCLTGQKTAIRVLNFDPQTGDPLGLVFQSAEDTPFILACNAAGKPDCEITFIPEMTGVQQSFKVYLSESTYDPMCTDSKIKILNERRKS
jgi:hypothetical protein